jgi:hypothetical protein
LVHFLTRSWFRRARASAGARPLPLAAGGGRRSFSVSFLTKKVLKK